MNAVIGIVTLRFPSYFLPQDIFYLTVSFCGFLGLRGRIGADALILALFEYFLNQLL